MNLENEILQLCFDVLEKKMTPLQAQKEILRLFDVVGQSEQFKCRNVACNEMVSSDSDTVFCEKHKRKLGN